MSEQWLINDPVFLKSPLYLISESTLRLKEMLPNSEEFLEILKMGEKRGRSDFPFFSLDFFTAFFYSAVTNTGSRHLKLHLVRKVF